MFPIVLMIAADPAIAVVRCSVTGDAHTRVYELQRSNEGERARWLIAMRSDETGTNPVVLPLPDAKPVVTDRSVALEYKTLNGGRNVTLTVDPSGKARLDVYTNFELEVNVDANLDPRVELMNTEGPIAALSCAVSPKP